MQLISQKDNFQNICRVPTKQSKFYIQQKMGKYINSHKKGKRKYDGS